MNKIHITMPRGIRYMSEATQILNICLPNSGKYILDKTLTGCGGTEFFLNSGRPLVLVSPRTGVLINKSLQHPECHLFRDTSKSDIKTLKDNLRRYLDRPVNIWGRNTPYVILVTLDSAKYVIEELKFRGIIDSFLFLTDEFQCLIGDAAFKGDVDLEFLKMLDSGAKNICYMSATPIDDTYLSALPEFQDVDYYKLQWDPAVIVEPTVKLVKMEKGDSAASIMKGIIADYRCSGYFASKIVDGMIVEAKEVVVFVNEVKTILQIINNNKLLPNEVTILISPSNKYAGELTKKGFQIECTSVNKANPRNTTFTFCSKASFEGRDFYSTSALTYIFIDGSKDWEIHDTAIEIPQMLGRQRLDANPFKYNAVIYYRTKPSVLSLPECMKAIGDKLRASQSIVDSYNAGDSYLKQSLAGLVKGKDPYNRYRSNYLDVVDNAVGGYSLEINYLVAASEHNLAVNKGHFYSNPLFLTTAIHDQMAISNTKSHALRDFEMYFNSAQNFTEKMRLYSTFLASHPESEKSLLRNPFIDRAYHDYFRQLGPDILANLDYDEARISSELLNQAIARECRHMFISGQAYTLPEVKAGLQKIYDSLGFSATAKANQIAAYIHAELIQSTLPDGSRPRMYLIK